MNEHPALILIMLVIGTYVLHIWLEDLKADRIGKPNLGSLPGAKPSSWKATWIAVSGAMIILAIETGGEITLGFVDEQSTITVLFGIYTLMAAFVEELIFRGFIVVEGKRRGLSWIGIIVASMVFAALHPFLWQWENGQFSWTLNAKGWFSATTVFISSLWFYTVRFASFNPQQSLIPCIAAHAAKNIGVFAIKGMQGFIAGWW